VAGRITSRHRREALKSLGNSVVPQAAEVIGGAILAAEAEAVTGRLASRYGLTGYAG
jgi:hypothetical protein